MRILSDAPLADLLDDDVDGLPNPRKKNRESVSVFLGGGDIVGVPISTARYYCPLAGWSVEEVRRRGGWRTIAIVGNSASNPSYGKFSIAPGDDREFLVDGTIMLERESHRVAVTCLLSERYGAHIVVNSAMSETHVGEEFARGVGREIESKTIYRGKCLSFGGSIRALERPAHKFEELAIPDETKRELLANSVGFLQRNEELAAYGMGKHRGILVSGPPGTGKSLSLKCLFASAEEITCVVAQSANLVSPHFVAELFSICRDLQPTIVAMEDLDILVRARDEFGCRTDALAELMNQVDGLVEGTENLVIVATVNRPEALDEALSRPSRFDRHIEVQLPDVEQRRRFVSRISEKIPVPQAAAERLVMTTAGLTCAGIQECLFGILLEADLGAGWDAAFSNSSIDRAVSRIGRGRTRLGFPGATEREG